jgi:hypothetical protein
MSSVLFCLYVLFKSESRGKLVHRSMSEAVVRATVEKHERSRKRSIACLLITRGSIKGLSRRHMQGGQPSWCAALKACLIAGYLHHLDISTSAPRVIQYIVLSILLSRLSLQTRIASLLSRSLKPRFPRQTRKNSYQRGCSPLG